MQEKSEKYSEFSERTERLATGCGIKLSDLPAKIGVSASMFHAYRSGKQPISDKVWRKLEQAEQESGLSMQQPAPDMAARTIPVLGWAHAGAAGNYDEIPKSWQERVPTECRDSKAFAIRLEGDSMSPQYLENDLLIVQPSEEGYNGCLAVIKMHSGGFIFRRIEIRPDYLRLIPLNTQWGSEDLPRDQIEWVYPVWGMWRQVWKR